MKKQPSQFTTSPSSENNLLLAIESSGAVCSVALGRGSASGTQGVERIAEMSFYEPNQHDERLAWQASTLLQALGVRVEELLAVCVSAGPGSFTGLRIGVALAKALCCDFGFSAGSSSAPLCVAVPTLTALALEASFAAGLAGAKEIVVATHSHKNLVYTQRFPCDSFPQDSLQDSINATSRNQNNNQDEPQQQPALVEWEWLCERLLADSNNASEAIYCVGTAFEKFGNPLAVQNDAVLLCHNTHHCTAAMVLQAGWRMVERGETADPASLVPLYAQEFVPKVAPMLVPMLVSEVEPASTPASILAPTLVPALTADSK
jgi:tRNA threonylcarbamoyl adenosine modification protein YeaZ